MSASLSNASDSATAVTTIYLRDYQPYPFELQQVELEFDLGEDQTLVHSRLHFQRKSGVSADVPLFLHGADLEVLQCAIDGQPAVYVLSGETLTVQQVPDQFVFSASVSIRPSANTSLEGLYASSGMLCTQCEAEGFRKITFFPDRPDVMSRYRVTLRADKKRYPLLLANGNPLARGEIDAKRHYAVWEDPFPKPCYLFALVAGDLSCLEDQFTTASGRQVILRIYAEPAHIEKCHHAMASLKQAMAWDESRYGREYDLDIFMIVAVSHFNMGAMENKGLNLFNISCVLADSETTTDAGFQRVESVVAHEYFHNWSGNRVTCRDWFQLSLKEGFTVFRDQQFSADMQSADVQRIEDVTFLRTYQFAEDAGPMAHAVRPASFVEINNFYTATVYEKGAELIRMLHTLLGESAFRAGSDLYFSRHDGQAVTTEDFLQAMQDASGRDLSCFSRWYHQPGTPVLQVYSAFVPGQSRVSLTLSQQSPALAELDAQQADDSQADVPQALVIPVRMAIYSDGGECLAEQLLCLEKLSQSFELPLSRVVADGEQLIVSVLRGASAPVKVQQELSNAQRVVLACHESDGVARWDAAQGVYQHLLLNEDWPQRHDTPPLLRQMVSQLLDEVQSGQNDPALLARMLQLPSEQYLNDQSAGFDPEKVHLARVRMRHLLAGERYEHFLAAYERTVAELGSAQEISARSMSLRLLANTLLSWLAASRRSDMVQRIFSRYDKASCMTDRYAALQLLVHEHLAGADTALRHFMGRYQHEPLALDQWFAVQSSAPSAQTLSVIRALLQHERFSWTNPNRVRAVLGTLLNQNPRVFHQQDGAGYRLLAEAVAHLDTLNPQVAARLLAAGARPERLDTMRRSHLIAALTNLAAGQGLSPDVKEVLNRVL